MATTWLRAIYNVHVYIITSTVLNSVMISSNILQYTYSKDSVFRSTAKFENAYQILDLLKGLVTTVT